MDYISLEELRAMSNRKLYRLWQEGEFPFDTASCGQCVTQHKYYAPMCRHEGFKSQAAHLNLGDGNVQEMLRANLPEIYALRMFFRDAYPSTPEPPVAAEEPRVLVAK